MLKSLEVFGFKSFADRTLFEFAPGITCVVGPNGSGKSNVVDAMKWLLGDQSPKSLRGKNMSDVIFNGSRSRKASGFAEASLSFGNEQRFLEFDSDLVKITRRLYEGGDSEYLINGEVSRLKDIKELFMGTGAATSAYSIIEQGRVGQVLQGNPSTRRILFDEAAGISRFKSRRLDAERKLERVSQNLLRLTDIVDEVETQLHASRSQAGKATKFRELARSYDALWLGLAADNSRLIFDHLKTLLNDSQTLIQNIQLAKTEQQSYEAERERCRLGFSQIDEQLQKTEGSLSTLMQQRSSLQTSLHHQRERTAELENDCLLLQKQRQELKRRVSDAQQEIKNELTQAEQAKLAVEQKKREREDDESQLIALSEQIDLQRKTRTELSKKLQEQIQEQAKSENHLSHLLQRKQTVQTACERVDLEIEQAQQTVEKKNQSVAISLNLYEQSVAKNEDLKQQISQIDARQTELQQQIDTIHARLREDREQHSAWEARLGLLEDMEKRQFGLSLGVQEILQRAKKSPLPPWKHVLGILADFIECDLEYAPLIEIALGGGSEMIVVDQLLPILEYLDRGEIQFEGRIGFLEVPTGKPIPQAHLNNPEFQKFLQTVQQSDQTIASAASLVECDSALRPLIERLLGDTWIVNSLTSARRFWLASPVPMQFLTLQGDLLSRTGTIQTGTLQLETSVVSRRSEIRRLKKEVLQLQRHIVTLTEQTGELKQHQTQLNAEMKNALSNVDDHSIELAAMSQKLTLAQTEQTQATQEQDRHRQDLVTLHQQQHELLEEIDREQQNFEAYQATLQSIRDQSVTLETEIQADQKQMQDLTHTQSQFQLGLAKVEEKLNAINNVVKRLQNDSQLRINQHREAKSRLKQATEKQSQMNLQILNAQSQLAELFLIGEQLQMEVLQTRSKREETQQQADIITEKLQGISEARREYEQNLQDKRIEQKDLENELESLAEKLADEYQLQLKDLHEQQVSAYVAYHAMRCGEEIPELDFPQTSSNQQDGTEQASESEEVLEPIVEQPLQVDPMSLIDEQLLLENSWAWEESEIPFEVASEEIEKEVTRLRKKIKKLGAVDPESLQGLDELEFRYKHLSTQLHDLKHAQSTLEDIIRKINTESRRIFVESFDLIRGHFQQLYRQLFGGGEGDILMEDESDPLECGIEIVARPPGKELRSISLLSGGEKTMTAVALLLAIFRSRPSPFCILDEVDAALDEANIDRFARVLTEFHDQTQFIVITHRKRTMTAADRIFGVTMEEAGISKRLTVRFDDVGENGEINRPGNAAAA